MHCCVGLVYQQLIPWLFCDKLATDYMALLSCRFLEKLKTHRMPCRIGLAYQKLIPWLVCNKLASKYVALLSHRFLTWPKYYRLPCLVIYQQLSNLIQSTPPPPGGFPIYYVPSSRTVSKRTPLEAPDTNSSKGVLLLTVLDEGTK